MCTACAPAVSAPIITSPAPSQSAALTTTAIRTTASVLGFGAVGDGVRDDTAAIQRGLDSLAPGGTLVFPAGRTFVHTAVLQARVPGTHLTGGATLLATAEATSSFLIAGNNISVDGLTFTMGTTTRRWDAFEQMKLRIGWDTTGVSISNVTINGSAAAGLYIGGASHFTVTDVTVANTRADAIHMTGGAHDGAIIRPTIRNPGDDGVAVVSYKANGVLCHHITVTSPRLYGQVWGRAFSVVGGTDITETDVYSDGSNGAAIYIAAEGEFDTYGAARVTFTGGTLVNSNTNPAIDHGAIMIYNSQGSEALKGVTVAGVAIIDTRADAPATVQIRARGGTVAGVALTDLRLGRGPRALLATNVPPTDYRATGWTSSGRPVPDSPSP